MCVGGVAFSQQVRRGPMSVQATKHSGALKKKLLIERCAKAACLLATLHTSQRRNTCITRSQAMPGAVPDPTSPSRHTQLTLLSTHTVADTVHTHTHTTHGPPCRKARALPQTPSCAPGLLRRGGSCVGSCRAPCATGSGRGPCGNRRGVGDGGRLVRGCSTQDSTVGKGITFDMQHAAA